MGVGREPSLATSKVGTRSTLAYPRSISGIAVDRFHGTTVSDAYRWLEDLNDPLVTDWVASQNALTSAAIERMRSSDPIRARLTDHWDYPKSATPMRIGRRSFVLRRVGLEEQSVLYVTDDGPPPVTTVLVDPNAIAADGSMALTGWTVDPGARFLAYALSQNGSDRQEIRIRDIKSGSDFPEVIRWAKSEEDLPFPNVAWAPNGTGFYYNRLPEPGTVDPYRHSQVYLHLVDTAQVDDVLIFERPDDPDLNFVPIVTQDGTYLVLHVWKGLSGRHQVYVRRLAEGGAFTSLLPDADARFVFLGNDGDLFYFHTNASAPRGRVISIDLTRPMQAEWVEVVAEQPDPISRAFRFDGPIVLITVQDSRHQIAAYGADGHPGPVFELPGPGTISDIELDSASDQLLVTFESFLRPAGVLRYDLETGTLLEDATPSISFDASAYVTQQHFVPAADGARIPILVVHRADMIRDGSNPLLLYGYGGFNVSTTPLFDPSLLLWLDLGGIYAIANPRGGGEYGEEWHEAGRRHAKQTCFDDFQTVAEWLIRSGYTTKARLAIRGESNGGLLVAACMLQRPDLFGAVICSVPVADMLRFPRYTIGHYWTHEYGDAQADQEAFRNLCRYSPLENVRADVDYPPILVTTGDGDDRVVPSHAMKFVASLQNAAGATSHPRLLQVQHDVGHGLGTPTSKIIDRESAILAFLLGTIGTDLRSP